MDGHHPLSFLLIASQANNDLSSLPSKRQNFTASQSQSRQRRARKVRYEAKLSTGWWHLSIPHLSSPPPAHIASFHTTSNISPSHSLHRPQIVRVISFNQAMNDEDDGRRWDRLASSGETSDVSGIISVQSPPHFYSSSPSRASSPSSPPASAIPTTQEDDEKFGSDDLQPTSFTTTAATTTIMTSSSDHNGRKLLLLVSPSLNSEELSRDEEVAESEENRRRLGLGPKGDRERKPDDSWWVVSLPNSLPSY